GCTKLDTTDLGADLLPAVDNVNTFASNIDILASQGIFNDTTKLSRLEEHVLGQITTDPEFGKTYANIYLQLKPDKFPFSIAAAGDTLVGLDSVVLALSFKRAWGDTSILQEVAVKEIPVNTGGAWDSVYKSKYLTYAPATGANVLYNNAPSKTINIKSLSNTVKFANQKDSSVSQIRIRLSDEYAAKLYNQDTAAITRPGFAGNAFYRDSTFRALFKGLAVESVKGEALMYINLGEANTRLEIHYRKKRNNVLDTAYTSLKLSLNQFGSILPSAVANKVVRDYAGTSFFPPAPGADAEIFLQTTPGTFADLTLPGLSAFRDTNRIIHRAQIRITQVPGPNMMADKNFTAPDFLYLDLKDTTPANNYKPVYLDLNPTIFYNPDNVPSESFYPLEVQYGYFGGFLKQMNDPLTGKGIAYYDFNITRYVQQMVTRHSANYDMRVFAPYSFSYPQYSPRILTYPNALAKGRVKVGGSSGNYKMQLMIVWSKIKVQ
ncbi:MAG: DUF4270 family protein, partial [Ferruginibacter sp.]